MREGTTIDDNEAVDTAAGTVVDTSDAAVRLTGIGKRFPGVIANDDVNLSVRRGTVHSSAGAIRIRSPSAVRSTLRSGLRRRKS